MAVFVLIEEDAFNQTLYQVAGEQTETHEFAVRRPLRGIQLAAPTYSNIRVIRRDGRRVALENSSKVGSHSTVSANFVIRQINEARQEKYQLLETFGETFGFFFGERPRILQFSGSLVSTPDFNWHSEWWHNYEHVYRGTRLVQQDARMYIQFDNKVVEGYMLDANTQSVADPNPNFVSLSFSFWVTRYVDISRIGSTDFPRPYRVGDAPASPEQQPVQFGQSSAPAPDALAQALADLDEGLAAAGFPQSTESVAVVEDVQVAEGSIHHNLDEYLLREGKITPDEITREVFDSEALVQDEVEAGIAPTLANQVDMPEDLKQGMGASNAMIAISGTTMLGSTPSWGGLA